MAELRERKPGSRLSPAQRTALKNIAASPGYQRAPRPKRQSNRSLHISVSLLILAFFVVYAQRNKPAQTVYSVTGASLPKWYAICSKEGRKVYTIPEEGGEGGVECVVVNDKRVADVGSLARVRRRYGDKATIGAVDQAPPEVKKSGGLKIFYLRPGHTLTPVSYKYSHGHPLQYGHSLQLPLSETRTKEEVIDKVEQYVLSQGDLGERWVEGMGWNQNKWPVQEFPTAGDLEDSPILKGLPIVLSRIDVHALWVSPAVLQRLGNLPEHIDGGQIVRDEAGRPTGIFVDNAMELVYAAVPAWTDAQREGFLGKMMDDALAVGMTGVHDAMLSEADYRFFQRMAESDKLRMRFYSMVYCDDKNRYCGDSVPRVHNAQDSRWTVRSVKLFADGALGSHGAALIDDYSDQPGWKGLLLKPDEVWEPLVREWYENGWQVNVHTIGDRANRIAIDAIETVLDGKPSKGQFRLEHAQILAPTDLERAARLGLIASYQPTHATSDMWYAEDRLGAERMKGAYAWKSYLDLGGRIALGSDFPVESIDPLKGFYAAVTRLDESGKSPHGPGGWYPDEKLTRLEAIRGMTVDAAYASMSNDTGSLTIGKRFDAVIWDDDLFTVVEEEILDTRVQATIIDGQLAFGSMV